jgi:hypothetical protein
MISKQWTFLLLVLLEIFQYVSFYAFVWSFFFLGLFRILHACNMLHCRRLDPQATVAPLLSEYHMCQTDNSNSHALE